ncbi:MFS transporter [Fodinicola acaciae]|uniref:MFS transporter n=1 Tax=Fodinicola acaciae TaxID=2681555 RepID=UPI0013D0576A|nr:MFS transporter [Fodinicola acaciae]
MPTSVADLTAVLRRGDFRRLMTTRFATQVADGVFQASLAGSVLFNPDRQADPLKVALGFAVLLLPYSLVGPFAGVLIDRFRRRDILIVSSLVRTVLMPVVAVTVWFGDQGMPFFLTALVILSVNRFMLAALSAGLPHVSEPDRLVTANAVSTTGGTLFYALGGGLGILLNHFVGKGDHGYAVVAALALIGCLVSALIARGFAPDHLGPDAHERARRDTLWGVAKGMVAGLRHVSRRRSTGYLLMAITGHRVLFGVLTILTLLLCRNYFRSGLGGVAIVGVAIAAGAFIAAVITPWATRRMAPRTWVTLLLLAAALAELAGGLPFHPAGTVAGGLLVGLAGQGIKIVTDTSVQVECEDDFRGRVFSVYDTLFNASMVAGLLIGAVVLPVTGKSYPVLVTVALGYAAIGGGYSLLAAHWQRPVTRPETG